MALDVGRRSAADAYRRGLVSPTLGDDRVDVASVAR
jgi:hypothetical protein